MTLKEIYWKPGNILVAGNKRTYIIVNDNICISFDGYETKDTFDNDFYVKKYPFDKDVNWDFSITEIYQVGRTPGLGLDNIFNCIEKRDFSNCDGSQFKKLWSRSVTLSINEIREKFDLPEGTEIFISR